MNSNTILLLTSSIRNSIHSCFWQVESNTTSRPSRSRSAGLVGWVREVRHHLPRPHRPIGRGGGARKSCSTPFLSLDYVGSRSQQKEKLVCYQMILFVIIFV